MAKPQVLVPRVLGEEKVPVVGAMVFVGSLELAELPFRNRPVGLVEGEEEVVVVER